MRTILVALVATFALSGIALAAEAEGHIKKIDADNQTITLDNGKSYKLPGEFDMSSIKEGMEIVIAYDRIGDVNQITDMDMSEE
jgi:hypothetical protein